MKTIKKFVILLFCVFIISFAGCKTYEMIELGFFPSGRDESSSISCAYRTEQSEFEIDNVNIEFFYGTIMELENFTSITETGGTINAELFFSSNDDQKINIKKIENFVGGKYKNTWVLDGEGKIERIEYSFSEIITVPKETFQGSNGFIDFCVIAYPEWSDSGISNKWSDSGSIRLYYKIIGQNVKISNKKV